MFQLSVIIPCYNIAAFADNLFDNLETQTVDKSKVQLIFVDDKSRDGSLAMLQTYAVSTDYAVKVIELEEHSMQGKARNTGVKYASGLYLYFMDSDDRIRTDAFEIICNYTKDYDPDLLIFKWCMTWDRAKVENSGCVLGEVNTPEERLIFFQQHNTFINRSCWDKVIRYNIVVDNDLKFAEGVWDEEPLFTLPAMLLAKRFLLADDVLYCYTFDRVGSSTNSLRRDNSQHLYDNAEVMLRTYEYCKKHDLIGPNLDIFECWFYMNYYVYSIDFNRQRRYPIPEEQRMALLANVQSLFPNYKKNKLIKKGERA